MSAHSDPWRRVTRAAPCGICLRSDWCSEGSHYWHCMRIASDKPCNSGGWFHRIDGSTRPKVVPTREEPKRAIDLVPLYMKWLKRTEQRHLDQLSRLLHVEELPLRALGVVWAEEHDAWGFPMLNSDREVTGMRLRNERGEKWAVRGGKNGLFVPRHSPGNRVYITEGPTDCAALLSLGLYAIGRPSCNEGAAILSELLPRLGVREAVIVADHDRDKNAPDGRSYNPGVDGALGLSMRLPVPNCIWLPPTKDARDFVKHGGTAVQIENSIRSIRWRTNSAMAS